MTRILLPLLVLLAPCPATAQQANTIDLLDGFEPTESEVVSGPWRSTPEGLESEGAKGARIILRRGMPANFDLQVEFTRKAGANAVGLILPIGAVSPALEISAWNGEAHGLSRVNGLSAKAPENPASVRPGNLENGVRHRLNVSVRIDGQGSASVTAVLDGEELFAWKGSPASLQPNLFVNVEETGALALAAVEDRVIFHSVKLLPIQAVPMAPAPPPSGKEDTGSGETGDIDLAGLVAPGTPEWEPFNGAAFRAGTGGSVQSRPEAGARDRGAYLADRDFSTGTIEVELKGSAQPQGSFLGVAFHGIDGDHYDSVYFRPFNFRSEDGTRRGHAVQYMSHPEFPWDELRRDRPEVFENPVEPGPAPTDWFRARIEVDEERIRVFVNDGEEPCLDVEKLGDTRSGKVGLWFNGIAAFRNFRVKS